MKASELREKSADELNEELLSTLKEQFALRMQQATGQLGRPSDMKVARRKIARIKTILAEMKAGK